MPPGTGTLYIWCKMCGKWFSTSKETYTGDCPACGTPVSTMKCMRCGYEWVPRTPGIPRRCAGGACRSPYYNKKRIR